MILLKDAWMFFQWCISDYANDGEYLSRLSRKMFMKPLVYNDSEYFWLKGGDCLFTHEGLPE